MMLFSALVLLAQHMHILCQSSQYINIPELLEKDSFSQRVRSNLMILNEHRAVKAWQFSITTADDG